MLSKVRAALGGRLRFCLCGGAELPMHVAEFFHALGIWVAEGYGLTETSPVIASTASTPARCASAPSASPLENVEVRLAEDGELLVRGPSVMQGYWNKPEATAEVFDDDGWFFHTGDIAEIDDDGFLLIVDRKKDLIVTAGGKNVAPQPIESSPQAVALRRHRGPDRRPPALHRRADLAELRGARALGDEPRHRCPPTATT